RLEQLAELTRRREVTEAIAIGAAIEQPERGELVDHLARQPAQGGDLRSRIGPSLIARNGLARPFQELPLARDRDAEGFRQAQTFRGLAVREERPAELADHQDRGLLGKPASRGAALLAHQHERLLAFHRREPPGEGDAALERRGVRLETHAALY